LKPKEISHAVPGFDLRHAANYLKVKMIAKVEQSRAAGRYDGKHDP
jgi:hypothetical protein